MSAPAPSHQDSQPSGEEKWSCILWTMFERTCSFQRSGHWTTSSQEQYLPSKGREGSDLHSWRHMKNWAEKREKGGNRCWVQGYTDPSCRYTQEHELKPAALTGLFPPQIQLIVPRVQHTPPKSHTAASRSKLGASLWSPLWTGMLEGTRYPREFGCRKGHFKERNNICAVLCLLLGYSSRCPCSLEGGWTLWRSLPTQIILWFYDIKQSKIH